MKYYLILLFFLSYVNSIACVGDSIVIDNSNLAYETKTLKIIKVTEHSYCHVSFLQTTDFGNVACNGMIVVDSNEALVFDTPANEEASVELINWVESELKCKIKGVVATHFHNDCLAGLGEFHSRNIPSYSNLKTIELANTEKVIPPQNGFKKSFVLEVGNRIVINEFLGEGHTKDNIVSYFPSEKVMFGGCLIKEIDAGKGYLGDANVNQWSKTVEKVKRKFSSVEFVIPGHGKIGNSSLFDYTIDLFRKSN